MTALAIVLLLAGVAGAVGRPFGLPAWVAPVSATAVGLVSGAARLAPSADALRSLGGPIGFLLAAVPLSVLLDRLGFFAAAATVLTSRSRSVGGLWILAAAVTTVLNLDAAVVLLTPLYIRIAHHRHLDGLVLASQPLILSWLASSALPVSNLTNLIAASETGATSVGFVEHLGLPSLVAVGVGWLCYRRVIRPGRLAPEAQQLDVHGRRALAIGGTVVGLVLVGFIAGRDIAITEWEVALAADVLLLAVLRGGYLPWRSVPLGTALVAAALGVLATAAVTHVSVGGWLGGDSLAGLARTAGVAALAANLINNLPALLIIAPALGHRSGPDLWAALVGVNMGPVLVVTATLASLLWVDTVRRMDVEVRSLDVTRIGLRVGLPGAAAGLATLLLLHAAGIAG
ncbi:MAG: citrate transporter [Actinomycetota bacterium]|nr:citrate transporter [Actinomycetota bacterium]